MEDSAGTKPSSALGTLLHEQAQHTIWNVTWPPLKEAKLALPNDRKERDRLTVTTGFLMNAEDLEEDKLHDSCLFAVK